MKDQPEQNHQKRSLTIEDVNTFAKQFFKGLGWRHRFLNISGVSIWQKYDGGEAQTLSLNEAQRIALEIKIQEKTRDLGWLRDLSGHRADIWNNEFKKTKQELAELKELKKELK